MNAADRFEDPAICVAKLGDGTMIPPSLAELLNPVDPSTFHVHVFKQPANTDVALHYHDNDEYWAFIAGHPRVTLRTSAGVVKHFDLGPVWADHDVAYYQYSSVLTGDVRGGHLVREDHERTR